MTLLELPTGLKVHYFSSIDEFPVGRKAAWTKYLLESGAMDTDIDSIKSRILDLMARLGEGRNEEVNTGLTNLYYSLNAIDGGYQPSALAFCVLVAQVDGAAQDDISPDGLDRLLNRLVEAGLTEGMIKQAVETVKKNSRPSENAIFLGLQTM